MGDWTRQAAAGTAAPPYMARTVRRVSPCPPESVAAVSPRRPSPFPSPTGGKGVAAATDGVRANRTQLSFDSDPSHHVHWQRLFLMEVSDGSPIRSTLAARPAAGSHAQFATCDRPHLCPNVHGSTPPVDITNNGDLAMSAGFVANTGHLPTPVRYEMVGSASTIRLFADGFALNLPTVAWNQAEHDKPRFGNPHDVRLAFVQSASNPSLQARDHLTTTLNDYRAADARQWRQNLRQSATVHYQALYPSIDLDYTLDATERLKSTYIVQPQGDPTLIRWRYRGVREVTITANGALVLTLPPRAGFAQRTITETAPIAWQNVGAGRVDVGVRFQISATNQVSFVVDQYDPALPLVIDPTLNTVTLTGLSQPLDMTTDAQGFLYIVGISSTAGRLIKRTPTGGTLSITLFGATGRVQGNAVAVAPDGRIAVVGSDSYAPDGSTQRSFVAQWSSSGSYSLIPFAVNAYTYADDVAYNPVTQTFFVVWSVDVLADANVQTTLAQVSAGGVISSQAIEPRSRDLAIDSAGTMYTTYAVYGLDTSAGKLVKRNGGTVTVFDTVGISKVAVDSANNVYTTGRRDILNGATVVEKWWEVQSWSASGTLRYRYHLSHTNTLYPNDLVVTADGTAVVVGMTTAPEFPIVGGSGSLQVGRNAGFIAHIAAGGVVSSDVSYQSATGGTVITSVALNPSPTVVVAGFASVDATFINAFISAPTTVVVPPPPPPTTTAPAYTVSYYEFTKNSATFRDQGCRARENGEQGIVFLFYGGPTATGASGYSTNPTYSDIRRTVKAFIDGYVYHTDCYKNSEQPQGTTVPAPKTADLTIAVSTSNTNLCPVARVDGVCPNPNPNVNLNVTTGEAWARMVAGLNYDVGASRIQGINVVGGLDTEPIWEEAHKGKTDEWIDGYANTPEAEVKFLPPLYIFGATDGGPRVGFPIRDWTRAERASLAQVYRWNFFRPITRSVPQIYNGSYAQEWYQVLAFTNKYRAGKTFAGTMTNCGSSSFCAPFPYLNSVWETYETCPQAYEPFEPTAGWNALSDRLNRTLKNQLTLTSDFRLPNPYRVSEGLSVTISGEGTLSNCEEIPARLLRSGTVFDAGNVFRYQITPAPVYTPETARSIQWSTDIYGSADKQLAPLR